MSIQEIVAKAEASGKEPEKLLKFRELVETVGFIEAILNMWGELPEEWLEPMTFRSWLTLYGEAPNSHPLKDISVEKMATKATTPEEWAIVRRKSRAYSDLEKRADEMIAMFQAREQVLGKE